MLPFSAYFSFFPPPPLRVQLAPLLASRLSPATASLFPPAFVTVTDAVKLSA